MTITVHVTQEDIDAGRRQSCVECPVALAMQRDVPRVLPVDYVAVGAVHATLVIGGYAHQAPLPHAAVRFVRSFDAGQPVEPFTFEVDIPCK